MLNVNCARLVLTLKGISNFNRCNDLCIQPIIEQDMAALNQSVTQ